MDNKNEQVKEETSIRRSINTALRIGFIALLLVGSFLVLKPFLAPVLWGIIIAVAIFPLHKRFSRVLGNREKLSATLLVLIGIALLVVPSMMFISSTAESMQSISEKMDDGSLSVPPPDESVADWPIVGSTVYKTWKLASTSISEAIKVFEPQIIEFAPKVLSVATDLVVTVLLFLISIVISGAFLVNTESAENSAKSIFRTLAGADGEQFSLLAAATIRSVVQGVLGTAVIQTFFLSIGMFVIGIPAAGVLSLIVLFVAVIQLPVLLIMIPVIIYAFTFAGTTAAVIFTIWAVIWSAADSFIKPMLMGRGVDIPMLVILLGAIGGMMMGGIIGLFIGAVLLAFAYKVFQAIMQAD